MTEQRERDANGRLIMTWAEWRGLELWRKGIHGGKYIIASGGYGFTEVTIPDAPPHPQAPR